MEDLTKHQLILLVLLITFVTSIATGIITFTLLQEAPVAVTQTINRVVEKTIETVVTEPGKPEKVVETVVINEEDRVLDAIGKNEKAIVRLKTLGADGSTVMMGLGIVISADGVVMVDSRSYSSLTAYTLEFYDGKSFSIAKVDKESSDNLVFLKPSVLQEDAKYAFHPSIVGDSDALKIGQTVVAVSGKESNSVSIGRIKQLQTNEQKKVIKVISDIPLSTSMPGSPILSLSGELVGIEAPDTGETHTYFPINMFKEVIQISVQKLKS